ncbi:MAG TPA: helix-turn-helix domain-containing protein [Natronosporangium sp.]
MTADQRPVGPDFATLVRQRRRAAGLTQAELANLAGLAVRTVREVESGRTSRPQRTTAVLLADAFGLAGEERAGFLGAARGRGASSPVPRPRVALVPRRVALPPAPTLVGREAELARLAELVADPGDGGPLTLVGVAGAGKTVLALAIAHQLVDRFPGGVAAAVVGAGSIESTIAKAAGNLAPREGPALLVIDAVDRAPGAVRAALAQLPPAVQVLATGRAPLGVPGEHLWPVPPLAVPPAGEPADLAEVAHYPAAALFLDRLARVRTEPPRPDEVPALVGLVRRLGGLPLAIELAAVEGRLLRLPEILQRYGDRVLDLGGEQSLRAAMAGSYQLLSPADQRALRWLAGFRDRWSMELAEQLLAAMHRSTGAAAGGPAAELTVAAEDPVPLLHRLVNLGLVAVRDSREHRFRLPAPVRDFATEQAERLGELPQIRRAHAVVIAGLVERVAPGLAGPGRPVAAARLDTVASEIWAALNHAANDDPQTALRLAAQLSRWWRFRGWDVVGRRWLRRLLDDPRTAGVDPVVRAWAMVGMARLACEHGAGADERPAAEAALAEFQRCEEIAGELVARRCLSMACLAAGRYDEARRHCLALLAAASRYGRLRDAAVAQLGLTWHELRAGNLDAARRRLAAADRLAGQADDRRLRLLATASTAEVARLAGRYEESVAIGHRVLLRLDELGDRGHRRRLLATIGQALAALGRVAEAERVIARLRADGAPAAPTGAGATVGGGVEPAAAGTAAVGAPAEAAAAMVEARLALARGEVETAVEWFTAAATELRGGHRPAASDHSGTEDAADHSGDEPGDGDHSGRRELVEVLVELAGCYRRLGDEPRRERVLAELARVCEEGGFALLPAERDRLG